MRLFSSGADADAGASWDITIMIGQLDSLCEAHPLVRPLRNAFLHLGEAHREGRVDDCILGQALAVALEFFAPSTTRPRLLEFALSVHLDQARTEHVFRSIAEAAPAEWRSSIDSTIKIFTDRCRLVWEHHAYLVFVDIKGDRCLFEQTVHCLCHELDCSVAALIDSLVLARPYADSVLQLLARQESRDLFERLHGDALRRWFATWQSRVSVLSPEERSRLEEADSHRFWESYFTHLLKITWPDFLEAFELTYCIGRCPVDIVNKLRQHIDPASCHQVLRHTWYTLMEHHVRITNLIPALIDDVVANIGSCIYRDKPLRPSCPMRRGRAESPSQMQDLPIPHNMQQGGSTSSSSMPAQSASSPKRAECRSLDKASRSLPWVPFAHSLTGAGDGDMMIPTPHDLRSRMGTSSDSCPEGKTSSPSIAWDDWVTCFCRQHAPWWGSHHEAVTPPTEEPLQMAALRAVNSNVNYTQRALIFRIVSGDLAQAKYVLNLHGAGESLEHKDKDDHLPCLVICANGTRCEGITKFGRTSSRRILLPDCPMGEPIASRSHFNVMFNQDADSYSLMDAGSKWGTFVKIGASMPLSCGDWIRVGGVEFIVRFCGGSPSCSKKHDHYRLRSLHLLREHTACIPRSPWRRSRTTNRLSRQIVDASAASGFATDEGASSSGEDEAELLEDELSCLLSSRHCRGWTASSSRICQHSATPSAGLPTRAFHSAVSSSSSRCASWPSWMCLRDRAPSSATLVPMSPLELDFISGPRMGEKLILSETVCTLGRGEGNTIQVNDSQLASVSRVHCIFECRGNWWQIRDNGSTNGTWRRLSCILEPSDPNPLHQGVSIQAGAHEFFVEEATVRQPCFPSTALQTFEEMRRQELHPSSFSRCTRSESSL